MKRIPIYEPRLSDNEKKGDNKDLDNLCDYIVDSENNIVPEIW